MSVHASSEVWSMQLGCYVKKLILLKLADNSNDDGECWPSIATIVRETEIAKSTVCRKMKELEDDGIIVRKRRGYCSTVYQFNMEKFPRWRSRKGGSPGAGQPCPTEGQPSPRAGHRVVPERDSNHQLNRQASSKKPPLDRANLNVGKKPSEPPNSIYDLQNYQ